MIPESELKEWGKHGITLAEPDDHILELKHNGEVMATFSQTGVDPEEIIREAEKLIKGE